MHIVQISVKYDALFWCNDLIVCFYDLFTMILKYWYIRISGRITRILCVKEVDMILGGDDGKECTYSKGYLPRQAVFSCITCCPEGNAGVCTACSMACHDGHEVTYATLIVLYDSC